MSKPKKVAPAKNSNSGKKEPTPKPKKKASKRVIDDEEEPGEEFKSVFVKDPFIDDEEDDSYDY